MDNDLLKTILGSSAVVGLLTAMVAGALKIYQNRYQAIREDNRYEISWAADYRTAAETHLAWDTEIRQRAMQSEYLINELREKLGMDPVRFEPIPPAPPLFPKRTTN